jgi:carbamoyl-phosphate synthase small subunit
VVFNTSHNGYEEIATDPSYYGQIMVMCAPQQGNYGVNDSFWESRQLWIRGFIALEIQKSFRDKTWLSRLESSQIPAMDGLDTRSLVLHLREKGTEVGAMVSAESVDQARELAAPLIQQFQLEQGQDWTKSVTRPEAHRLDGALSSGPRVAVVDYGCKQNIIRELLKRCRQIILFPSTTSASDILAWKPDGILLSNGPGDPAQVVGAVETIQSLIGQKPIFGICMGHQLLGRALGGTTYKLKFGHRGANHPIKDLRSGEVYVTSQNHGYALDMDTLPKNVQLTHVNLNDHTVSGIDVPESHCFSVQFHPESHPGPREAQGLFDQFIERIIS